jgi:hypothetical protein
MNSVTSQQIINGRLQGAVAANIVPLYPKVVSFNWLRSNLKTPSLGLALFLLGVNGLYFHPLIFPQSRYDTAPLGTFRYIFLSLGLVTAGAALEMRASNWWLFRRKPFWSLLLLAAIGWMTMLSMIEGEPLENIIHISFPFYWLLLVPAVGLRERNWAWLWLTFLAQAPLGVIFSMWAFFTEGAVTRIEINYLTGQNFLAICLYMGIFFFLFLPALRSRLLVSAAIGLFVFQTLQAFFYSSRLPLLLLPVEIGLVLYMYFRLYGASKAIQRVMMLFVFLGLSLGIILTISGADWAELFGKSYDALMVRMLEKGTLVDTILENERWYESQSVLATMEMTDWITGQGLGARWSAPGFAAGEERRMVHNTWLNSFYWGGVLLFLAIALPVLGTLRVFLRSRRAVALTCAAYMLLLYIKFPAYVITNSTHEWILFCLAWGVCVWEEFQLDVAKRKSLTRLQPSHAMSSQGMS